MSAYDLMCATHHQIIRGEPIDDAQKTAVADQLLGAVSGHDAVERYHRGVRADAKTQALYPLFYIPPYNDGKKLRLLTGQLPGTHILSSNHYELETLRLLALWKGEDPRVQEMLAATRDRLERACFGRFCPTGECVGAGVSALRFFLSIHPQGGEAVDRLLAPLGRLFAALDGTAAARSGLPVWYFCLALSQAGLPEADRLIEAKKEALFGHLIKDWPVAKTGAKAYNPIIKHVIRNALSRLPAFAQVAAWPVTVSREAGRCACNAISHAL